MESASEGLIAVCRAVIRAIEKLEEEWSPSFMDVLIFHSNQLYRLLLAYCNDEEVLEKVGRSLSYLAEIEVNMAESSSIGCVTSTVPSSNEHSIHVGRPKFNITREQIQHLLELHFSCPKIACLFGVSLRTIIRRMAEYELSVSNFYANISDEELERQVNIIRVIYPNCGYRMMDGHLRQRGIRITQSRLGIPCTKLILMVLFNDGETQFGVGSTECPVL